LKSLTHLISILITVEKSDGASEGKYTIGLGQTNMAFCGDREDVNSFALTAVHQLLEKYHLSDDKIGRLEVGTETLIDKSKSLKTVLMQLFTKNTNLEGVDNINACYGGTAAFFNSLNWVDSIYWDSRLALVVAGDIAVYTKGNARCTGGAATVAFLVGPNAPLVIERGIRGTYMEHVYDFYKPNLASEYPTVDGHLSNPCYVRSLDNCFARYKESFLKRTGQKFVISKGDYFIFHSPYNKLVQKAFARLLFNEFLETPSAPEYASQEFEKFKNLKLEDTYTDKDVESVFMKLSKKLYDEKVAPGALLAKELGNSYCGSLYAGLCSLISTVPSEKLQGKRVVMFSYGSGSAASMFSIVVKGSISELAVKLDAQRRLSSRIKVHPDQYHKTLEVKEQQYGKANFIPNDSIETLFPGTYYVESVDDMYRRKYLRKT